MVCRIPELLVNSHWPIVIIGAGQAGLSAAHYLWRDGLKPGRDFIVLDAGAGPGGAWRNRWDSLTLGSTNHVADLPGFPLGQPDPSVPASAVVSDYYSRFERELELCVVRPAEVATVKSPTPGSGLLEITAKIDGERVRFSTQYLINSTGTWTRPYVPFVPGIAEFEGRQLHTANFRDVEDFRGLTNSGRRRWHLGHTVPPRTRDSDRDTVGHAPASEFHVQRIRRKLGSGGRTGRSFPDLGRTCPGQRGAYDRSARSPGIPRGHRFWCTRLTRNVRYGSAPWCPLPQPCE